MGNEQSVPRQSTTQRPANRLSKPRTNNHLNNGNASNANAGASRTSVPNSRRNSITSAVNCLPTLHSESWPANTVVADPPKVDPPKKKRLPLFRSRASKREEVPVVEPDVFENFEDQRPNIRMLDRYHLNRAPGGPRTQSFTTAEATYEPQRHDGSGRPVLQGRTHRWSTQQIPLARYRGNASVTSDGPPPGPNVPAEVVVSRYGEERTSTGLRSITAADRTSTGLRSITATEAGYEENLMSRYNVKSNNVSGSGLRSRTSSETAIYGPIRRRSLQQHGVATRTSYFDGNFRQDTPVNQVPAVEQFHGQSEQHSSQQKAYTSTYYTQQTNQNNMQGDKESSSDLVGNLRPTPEFLSNLPRTQTPTDEEYGHTGVFKLGTLRVMNGAASPAYSDSFYGETGDEDVLSMRKISPYNLSQSVESTQMRGNTRGETPITNTAWTSQPESHLYESPEGGATTSEWETQEPLPLPDLSFEPFDLNLDLPKDSKLKSWALETGEIKSSSVEVEHPSSFYNATLSPFSYTHSPPISPKLETTSKHMAAEDSLFDPEPQTPTISTRTMPRSHSNDSGYGPPDGLEVSRSVEETKELNKSSLAKADSGYSSNISLRSFQKEHRKSSSYAKEAANEDSPSRGGSGAAYSFASSSSSEGRKLRLQRSLPALPNQTPKVPSKESLRKPSGPPVSMRKTSGNAAGKNDNNTNKEDRKRTAIPKALYDSVSGEPSPGVSELSTNSRSSTASPAPSTGSSRWRLASRSKQESGLRQKSKAETLSQQTFTVQALGNNGHQLIIPHPSIEARQQLEKREQGFPVNTFMNTPPLNLYIATPLATQLRRTGSKETLGTIFSVGSLEVREELGFARLQQKLPAVPVEQTIPEDRTTSPTIEPLSSMHQVQARLRDGGRRSIAANYVGREAPDSRPQEETERSPQSPARRWSGRIQRKEVPSRTSELEAAELPNEALKTLGGKHDLNRSFLSLSSGESSPVSDNKLEVRDEFVAQAQQPNDRKSLPSQMPVSPPMPGPVTNKESLPPSNSETWIKTITPAKSIMERNHAAPGNGLFQHRPTPSPRPISTYVSVPILRSIYQPPDPAVLPPVSSSTAVSSMDGISLSAEQTGSNARLTTPRKKAESKINIIQGPTNSHVITSIATYPVSDTYKTLNKRASIEAPSQSPKSFHSTSSRRSLRGYPPQAHANRGSRLSISIKQAPPPPGPTMHDVSVVQERNARPQVSRKLSQEFDSSNSPRMERSGNKPPVSMTTQRNTVYVKKPVVDCLGQDYFALRNGATLGAAVSASEDAPPSWEPTRKLWSQRRASAGTLNQSRRNSIESQRSNMSREESNEALLRRQQGLNDNGSRPYPQVCRSSDIYGGPLDSSYHRTEPVGPPRRLSIDNLPSQNGHLGLGIMRPESTPVDNPQYNGAQGGSGGFRRLHSSRSYVDVSQQHQISPAPSMVRQGSNRSFNHGQAGDWTEKQKMAWSVQSQSLPLPHYPPSQPSRQEILSADPLYPMLPNVEAARPKNTTPAPYPTSRTPSTPSHNPPPQQVLRQRSSNPQFSRLQSMGSQENMLILDRYSGGLGYNFELGMGISGSMGTGTRGQRGAVKSVGQREMYGVDLADVPVMLQRVRVDN